MYKHLEEQGILLHLSEILRRLFTYEFGMGGDCPSTTPLQYTWKSVSQLEEIISSYYYL
jgi:hypothetical protein